MHLKLPELLNILLDYNFSRDWIWSFRNVPKIFRERSDNSRDKYVKQYYKYTALNS